LNEMWPKCNIIVSSDNQHNQSAQLQESVSMASIVESWSRKISLYWLFCITWKSSFFCYWKKLKKIKWKDVQLTIKMSWLFLY
jgi:hypothetical protein